MKRWVLFVALVLGVLPGSVLAGTEYAYSMFYPRYQHVRVALTDGRALIAGGVTNSGFTASAEFYNPVMRTFSAAPPMSTLRANPASVRLADGRVLVAGGSGMGPDGTFGLTTSEIYDPATNTWSATGSMSTGRRSPYAALLQDGRVLVVGGELNVMSAEVYDPVTGTFSPTAPYTLQRYDQAMTLLGDGRVLLVGGMLTNGSMTPIAEIWDPATGTWSTTGSMIFARYRHTATLLPDGRALIAGGNTLAGAEIFDPATGTFSITGSLVTPRSSHSAAVMGDGNVIIAGGTNINGTTIATLERYDVAAGTWRAAGSMVVARRSVGTTLLADGDVLLSGGINTSTQATPAAEIVDPVCNTVPASLSPATLPFGIAGGPGSVSVTHAEGCFWRVTGQIYSWITNNPVQGTGSGTVPFTVAANTSSSARTATFTIADATFQVTQAGDPCSGVTLSPASQNFVSGGGNGTATLAAGAACAWTVSGAPSWITIGSGGTGGSTIPYNVAQNPGAARSATLSIAGRTLAITQNANSCSPAATISPISRSIAANGASTTVTVTAAAPCSWSVSGLPSWMNMSPQSGSGSATLNVTVYANATGSQRVATVTVAGRPFTITQAPNLCAGATVSPSSQVLSNAAGTASVEVTAPAQCAWTVSGVVPAWMTLTSGTTGAGVATVTMSVADNVSSPQRSTTLYVAGTSFSVTQAAGSCYPLESLSSTGNSASATGASRSVQVTANPGCPWTITQVPPWITITSPQPGSGSSTVTYEMAPNLGVARSATLLIGSRSYYVDQTAPGFATLPDAPLIEPRIRPGTVTLGDGRILVVGGHVSEGDNYASALASAEIYDPATSVFALVAPMSQPRSLHVTAKLDDGRVLVAGGGNATVGGVGTSIADAEVFDPATNTWSPTDAMPAARARALSVTLADGRVLVVGGINGMTTLADAVVYDPATGAWSSAGNMIEARNASAIALLPDGKVLVAGGLSATSLQYLTSAETWDPSTGLWSPTGSMAGARSDFSMTPMLGGLVLVSGGGTKTLPAPANAEIYNPSTGTFTQTGALGTPRSDHAAVLLSDGGVAVIGGLSHGLGSTSYIERYDPPTGTWRMVGQLTDSRIGNSAVRLSNGKVLAIGGSPGPRRVTELFDPTVCSPSAVLSPTNQSLSGSAGGGTVGVTLNHASCPRTAVTQASWITVTQSSLGSGSGSISYTVSTNLGAERTGTIEISGTTFTVVQGVASSTGYCASRGNTSSFEWIQQVTVAGSVRSTGNNSGYVDATAGPPIAVARGSNAIALQGGGAYAEYWRVWIDFNRDGTFSDSEIVYSGYGAGTLSSSITVPATALAGNTRMRISLKYASAPTACETFAYGEVEDYTVAIP